MTAANGDQIFSTITYTACIDPGSYTVTGTSTITGGTGRFAGASGTFTRETVFVGDEATGTGTFTDRGTIAY